MALTIVEKRNRALEKARAAQQRAIEKQRAKLADPAEREKKLLKQRAAATKQIAKQRAKVADPEYRANELKKVKERQQKAALKATSKPKSVKQIKSKGLKGRTPTATERSVMNKIGSLSCICCLKQGRDNPLISLHHLDGRTKEHAHCLVLPLCAGHHDTPAINEVLALYPDLIPYHAKGSLGGKAAWRKIHGNEYALLAECYELANIDPVLAGGFTDILNQARLFPNVVA